MNLAIRMEKFDLVRFLLKYVKDDFDVLDQYHNTYLHNLLLLYPRVKIPFDLINEFIYLSQINIKNYNGTSCLHLLFRKNLWIYFTEVLKLKNLEILSLDENGKNIYSYIKKNQYLILYDILKKSEIEIPKQKIYDNIIQLSKTNSNFGKFNSNLIHNMIYTYYLMDKHKNLWIVSQPSDNKKQNNFIQNLNENYYDIDQKHFMLWNNLNFMATNFFKFLPHYIVWINKDHFYIYEELTEILKNIPPNKDFIMLKISVILSGNMLHANVFIYDIKQKIGWRFEPTGVSKIANMERLDDLLEKILKKIFKNITYRRPSSFLSNTTFQLTSQDEDEEYKKHGDPLGYCLAWCIWFVDFIVSNQGKIDFVNSIPLGNDNMDLVGSNKDKEYMMSNRYINYIRAYGNHLDQFKNKLLLNLGINEMELYNLYMDDVILDKIIKKIND